MSLSDLKSRFFPGKTANRADPAHAFGSEEQVMAAFAQQNYVKPQPGRASVLAGLRERLGRSQRTYSTDAPVYSADTYAQPSAPDLGWEAAFEAPAEPQPVSDESMPTAEQRFEAFRQTVYASPVRPTYAPPSYSGYDAPAYSASGRPAPVYEVIGAPSAPSQPRELAKPIYEEISFRPPAPRENAYARPVYEEIDLSGRGVSSPVVQNESAEDPSGFDTPLQTDAEGAAFPPESGSPDLFAEVPRQEERPPRAGDLQYFFWSGSIVAGTILTLFAFIYACTL